MPQKFLTEAEARRRGITEDDADYLVSEQRLNEPTVSADIVIREIEQRLGRPVGRHRAQRNPPASRRAG